MTKPCSISEMTITIQFVHTLFLGWVFEQLLNDLSDRFHTTLWMIQRTVWYYSNNGSTKYLPILFSIKDHQSDLSSQSEPILHPHLSFPIPFACTSNYPITLRAIGSPSTTNVIQYWYLILNVHTLLNCTEIRAVSEFAHGLGTRIFVLHEILSARKC